MTDASQDATVSAGEMGHWDSTSERRLEDRRGSTLLEDQMNSREIPAGVPLPRDES